MDDIKEGWICPRCKSVNAPYVKQCKCVHTEDKDKDNRQLLTEFNLPNLYKDDERDEFLRKFGIIR